MRAPTPEQLTAWVKVLRPDRGRIFSAAGDAHLHRSQTGNKGVKPTLAVSRSVSQPVVAAGLLQEPASSSNGHRSTLNRSNTEVGGKGASAGAVTDPKFDARTGRALIRIVLV